MCVCVCLWASNAMATLAAQGPLGEVARSPRACVRAAADSPPPPPKKKGVSVCVCEQNTEIFTFNSSRWKLTSAPEVIIHTRSVACILDKE